MENNRKSFACRLAVPLVAITLVAGCTSNQPRTENSDSSGRAEAAPQSGAASQDRVVVKGLGGWEGEIFGKPAANSKFKGLQIGMSMREATDIAGQPTDQGAYITGKAWIPFYFGSDRHRHEMVYRGQGRLVFAGNGGFAYTTHGNLIMIIHNDKEGGYR